MTIEPILLVIGDLNLGLFFFLLAGYPEMVLASIWLNAIVSAHNVSIDVRLDLGTIKLINMGEILHLTISHIPQNVSVIVDDTSTMSLRICDVVFNHLEFTLIDTLFLVDLLNGETYIEPIDILIVPVRFVATRASVYFLLYG